MDMVIFWTIFFELLLSHSLPSILPAHCQSHSTLWLPTNGMRRKEGMKLMIYWVEISSLIYILVDSHLVGMRKLTMNKDMKGTKETGSVICVR